MTAFSTSRSLAAATSPSDSSLAGLTRDDNVRDVASQNFPLIKRLFGRFIRGSVAILHGQFVQLVQVGLGHRHGVSQMAGILERLLGERVHLRRLDPMRGQPGRNADVRQKVAYSFD